MTGVDLATLSSAATGGLIAAVWQGGVLSLAVGLGLRLVPKTSAAVRFAIWFGVFAVVTVLPVAGSLHGTASVTSRHAAWLTLDARWCLVVAGAWGMASLMRAVTLVMAVFRVRTLWKRATPLKLGSAAPCDEVVMNRQPGRQAQLCVSHEVDRPTVIGFFAPRILLPGWLVEKLTAAELEQIVLHEGGHLSRGDDWINLLQKIALVVFPLNPALAWVERRLCFERELACDEYVLRATAAPKAYAQCLATLAGHRLAHKGIALALGALGRESELGRRVRKILGPGELMPPAHSKLLLGGAMLALLIAAAGLEHCPQLVGFANGQPMHALVEAPAVSKVQASRTLYRPVTLRAPVQSIEAQSRQTVSNAHGESNASAKASIRARQIRSMNVSEGMSPRVGGEQWVVLTTWQREDGARVVMTVQTIRGFRPESQVVRGNGDAAASNTISPYAAVPVRDGWLVFQL